MQPVVVETVPFYFGGGDGGDDDSGETILNAISNLPIQYEIFCVCSAVHRTQ